MVYIFIYIYHIPYHYNGIYIYIYINVGRGFYVQSMFLWCYYKLKELFIIFRIFTFEKAEQLYFALYFANS